MLRPKWLNVSAVILIAALAAILLVRSFRLGPNRSGPSQTEIENGPLVISANQTGRFSKGWSWDLNVDAAGKAILKSDSFPNSKTRKVSGNEFSTNGELKSCPNMSVCKLFGNVFSNII